MPAGSTYTPIQSVTSTGQTTISFTSIPSTYTDLILVINGYSTAGYGYISLNSTAKTTMSYTRLLGYSGGALSDRATAGSGAGADGLSIGTSASGNEEMHFMNYSNTSTYKTILCRENGNSSNVGAYVYLWQSTSAINSIDLTAYSGTFASGTVATIYGIASA
jgi:hypothetical protein